MYPAHTTSGFRLVRDVTRLKLHKQVQIATGRRSSLSRLHSSVETVGHLMHMMFPSSLLFSVTGVHIAREYEVEEVVDPRFICKEQHDQYPQLLPCVSSVKILPPR